MASIEVQWWGVGVTLSEAETKQLENIGKDATQLANKLASMLSGVPLAGVVAQVLAGWLSIEMDRVTAVDQGYGVNLTLPWPAIWFDQFWIIVPTAVSPPPVSPSQVWPSLGTGLISSDPTTSINYDGRLEVFARGTDNSLYHIWQTTPGGGWSGWAGLGGGVVGDPAAARNIDGRLEVFVHGTDNSLYHISQTSPGGGWSGWAGLGGGIVGDPVATINGDGRLEVFVHGTDNSLYHIWQTSPGGGWSGWAGLGGVLQGEPAAGMNVDGRLEVFVVGIDYVLYHIWQTSPGGGWSSFAPVTFPMPFSTSLAPTPSVTVNKDGRLEAFVRGVDNSLYHVWQISPGRGWSPLLGLGGSLAGVPVATANADGRLEVFARLSGGTPGHIWQSTPGGAWTGYV